MYVCMYMHAIRVVLCSYTLTRLHVPSSIRPHTHTHTHTITPSGSDRIARSAAFPYARPSTGGGGEVDEVNSLHTDPATRDAGVFDPDAVPPLDAMALADYHIRNLVAGMSDAGSEGGGDDLSIGSAGDDMSRANMSVGNLDLDEQLLGPIE